MKRKTRLTVWLVVGCVLASGPIWGRIATVVGMVMAFNHLGHAEPNAGALAQDISLALYTTAAGLLACPIGIAMIVISSIKLNKRSETIEGLPNQKVDPIN